MRITNKGRDGIQIPGLPGACQISGRGTVPGTENLVFYMANGRQYVRTYVKPSDPKTEKQTEHRNTFGEVVKRWRELPPEVKAEYNHRAFRMKMSGFNLFVSETFKKPKP